jgi:hypothetical protein
VVGGDLWPDCRDPVRRFSALCERTPAFEQLVFEHLVVLVLVGLVDANEATKAFADLGVTTTLKEVIADLGLKPLSAQDEQRVRDDLGVVVGRGWEIVADSPKWNLEDDFTVADVQATLLETADGLDAMIAGRSSQAQVTAIEKVLHGAETGFRERLDTEVALKIIGTLRQEIGHDKARTRVIEFRRPRWR